MIYDSTNPFEYNIRVTTLYHSEDTVDDNWVMLQSSRTQNTAAKPVAETGEGCLRTLICFGPGTEPRDDPTELSRLDVVSESVVDAADLLRARG